MSLCTLFRELSECVWDAIERAYTYTTPTYDGLLETSITDGLLSTVHLFGHRRCVVWVPQEVKTGADLDLIVMGKTKGMHFRLQAKKLKRNENYEDMNHSNARGYQVNLLCSDPKFYPLYLFYNRYADPSKTYERMRMVDEGCAVASARRIKRLINPGLNGGASSLSLDTLLPIQLPWWTLVCPRSDGSAGLPARARSAARLLATTNAGAEFPDEPDDGVDTAYHELEGPYRALWEARGGLEAIADGIQEMARPVIMLGEGE